MKLNGFACILISTIFLTGCVTASPDATSDQTAKEDSTEEQFTVVAGEVYRLNIYVNEGDIITGYWKASDTLYSWYTDSRSYARTIRRQTLDSDIEPYEMDILEPGTYDTYDRPRLRYYDDKGNYVVDGWPVGCQDEEFQIEAKQTGYYSLCFLPFHFREGSGKSIDVIIRYWVD